jgi:hypothetical protein
VRGPDNAAIVVIEEASGTIVMGADVLISTVAIAQARRPAGQHDTARPGGEPERSRYRSARHDQHSAVD